MQVSSMLIGKTGFWLCPFPSLAHLLLWLAVQKAEYCKQQKWSAGLGMRRLGLAKENDVRISLIG